MTDIKIRYDKETAAAAKAALEARLNNGESLTSDELRKEAEAYLEIERGIVRLNNPIDPDCQHIPPWERTPKQVLRNVDDTDTFTPDETGLCRRFVAEVRGWFAWNDTDSQWYVWTGTHWTNENAKFFVYKSTENLKEQMQYELPANMELTTETTRGKQNLTIKVNRDWQDISKAAAKLHTREQVVKAARADLFAKFDADKRIPFKNCMFNPETGEKADHKPTDYNTTVCPYDLNLTAPSFMEGEKFIMQIACEDPEWIDALYRILGYCLLYGNPNHLFIVFYGSGGNGKSLLVDWIAEALGNLTGDVYPTEISRNNKDGRQTELCKKVSSCRFLFFKEGGNIQYDDDLMQALTGERTIVLKRIQTGTDTYDICGTPIMITNNMPSVEKGGYSMQRRQIGLPFDFRIDPGKVDLHLFEKLTTREGCEWLICQITKALIDLLKSGQQDIRTMMPARVTQFTETLTTEADIVLQWKNECCTIDRTGPARISRTDLYNSFCGYAYSPEGLNPTPGQKYRMTVKTFAERLRGFDIVPYNTPRKMPDGTQSRNIYPGISLNERGDYYRAMGEIDAGGGRF